MDGVNRYSWPLVRMHGRLLCLTRVLFKYHPSRSQNGTQPKFFTRSEVRQNLGFPPLKMWGPKTTYFRVVLRRHCDSSASIFGTKRDRQTVEFKSRMVRYISRHSENFGPKTAAIRWFPLT